MLFRNLLFIAVVLCSCGQAQVAEVQRYEDIKGFFEKEALRLTAKRTRINKTVSRNGVSESREGLAPDWQTEFSLFRESDINKPAWTDSYQTLERGDTTIYQARDPELKTRSVSVVKNDRGKITAISIVNRSENSLYTSTERLDYISDLSYRIVKDQSVLLIGKNQYIIKGSLIQ